MDEKTLHDLVQKTSDVLEEYDIHVWDVNVFMYDMGGVIYKDYASLAGAIEHGAVTTFMEVDAMLGDKVWELIETFNS